MFYEMILPVLVFLGIVIGLTAIARPLIFQIPAMRRTLEINQAMDAPKMAQQKYIDATRVSKRTGMLVALFFILIVSPLLLTLQARAWWLVIVDVVAVLMIYDFFYYLMHRFLFHGQGKLRRVHAVHHQARKPSTIDGDYVHPVETLMGLGLFALTMIGYGLAMPEHQLHAVSAGVATLIYFHLNVINHVHIDLPYFPFKTLHWIAAKHDVHHENMHKGNYASITLLFDKMFGTLD
ncbi:MAG TPA: sterol desaturase family protein [Spongiibacteraceae bacterium]|jgi:sterol desaturase/sphingolipid hydroxylase (fatty acid hydroxylase superfamily)|nr:sterol desaturase family protein [Spongiibacteraceae bacterium]HUH39205.1 sterol desaturase family protein [Spongiibacteraceae bacterium]